MIRPLVGKKPPPTQVIHTNHSSPKVKIYPNPVTGKYLYVDIENKNYQNVNDFHFQIFDVHGRMIMSNDFKSKIPIDNISEGIYIIQIFDKNTFESLATKKIIKGI